MSYLEKTYKKVYSSLFSLEKRVCLQGLAVHPGPSQSARRSVLWHHWSSEPSLAWSPSGANSVTWASLAGYRRHFLPLSPRLPAMPQPSAVREWLGGGGNPRQSSPPSWNWALGVRAPGTHLGVSSPAPVVGPRWTGRGFQEPAGGGCCKCPFRGSQLLIGTVNGTEGCGPQQGTGARWQRMSREPRSHPVGTVSQPPNLVVEKGLAFGVKALRTFPSAYSPSHKALSCAVFLTA